MRSSDDHAGLERVASLLGNDASEAVFAAATEELARVADPSTGEVHSEMAVVSRYEADRTFTVLEYWGEPGGAVPRSSRWPLEGRGAIARVYETAAVARVDGDGEPGPIAGLAETVSTVAVPISFGAELWGSLSLHGRRPLPDGIEDRITAFARLVGAAVASADVRRAAQRLAEEQAALRRVATLVGRGVPQEELFEAVAGEIGRLLEADAASLIRYEPSDAGTVLAWWAPPGRERAPVAHTWPARGGLATRIAAARRAVRIDDWGPVQGPVAEFVRDRLGIRSSLGGPIIVGDRVWGSLMAHSLDAPLPAEAELRLMSFAELVATTITNEESRAEVRRLADRQAALREVATLVAGQPSPQDVFAAVVEQVGQVLDFDVTRLLRYRSDGAALHIICWPPDDLSPGAVIPLDGDSVAGRVLATGRPSQIADYTDVPGTLAEVTRNTGGRSAVGAPIVVDARLWGVLVGISNRAEPLSTEIETRLSEFTALVATAISNVEARAEVRRLVDHQAALRRVATLVAAESSPEEVFSIVVEEVNRVMDFDVTRLMRLRPDGAATHLVSWPADDLVGGTTLPLDGDSVTARVQRSARPARIEDYSSADGPMADTVRAHGGLAAVGVPIVADGLLWGVLVGVSNRPEPLSAEIESQLEEFSALIATAISNVEARAEVRRLADEQAALRRVATLVARQPSAEEVFPVVVEELGRVLGFDFTRLVRYRDDGWMEHVISWPPGDAAPGTRWPLDGDSVVGRVKRTWRPSRIDDFSSLEGFLAKGARARGMNAVAGAPIIVGGQLWGALIGVSQGSGSMQVGIEARIEEFTALIANAISNAQARSEVNRLADEQAALRRVATLVARQPSAEEVFDTVVQEVGRLLPVDDTRLVRFEPDGSGTMVSGWPPGEIPIGLNRSLDGDNLSSRIRRSWAPGRMDDYAAASGTFASYVQRLGTRAAAGAPIIVEGRMWGTLVASSREPQSLPPDIEWRIEEFTALIATAISNVEARAALAASRERIVVATDDARRRFERDLHDGAQQRLVSLALELRLAEQEATPALRDRIGHAVEGITGVLDDLRELSSGLHPAILSEGGLRPALRALARRSAVPVRLRDEPEERFEERVEVAAYYVVSEALANAAKHAEASVAEVSIVRHDGWLSVSIRDDGRGGADSSKGSGLVGLSDRVEALGGTIAIASATGAGTAIEVELPLVPSSPR